MSAAFLKIIGFVLLTFTIAKSSKFKNKDQNSQNLAVARRSLLEREREYFKTQPMSDELRSFIERYKRKTQKEEIEENDDSTNDDKRNKRNDEIDENLLYMVKNGQLVPLKPIKSVKRSDEEEKKSGLDSYTVVPLIIPIGLKSPEAKLIKTRTLDEAGLQGTQNKDDAPVSLDGHSSTVGSVESNKETVSNSRSGENEPETTTGDENNNSTQEETKVLHRILEDVEGLMQWKHEGNKKEGVLCNLNGSWISDAAGMRFDICYKNSTRKKFRIHVADRIPPNEDGFLCDGNWTVFGELPFLHSGMVIALAVHQKDKHIATFIGECRICEGSETVTGTWLIGRSSRDCKDQKAAHKILSDVWKREQAHTLRKKHLQKIGYNVNEDEED